MSFMECSSCSHNGDEYLFPFLDFERQAYRYGVPFNTPHHHPQKTLHAMRILAGIDDQETRITLSKAFYKVSYST